MHPLKICALLLAVAFTTSAFSASSLDDLKKEGEKDGKRYAQDLRNNGMKVDGTSCAVGVAAEDDSRPELSQTEIETYAKAYANACMGRDVI